MPDLREEEEVLDLIDEGFENKTSDPIGDVLLIGFVALLIVSGILLVF